MKRYTLPPGRAYGYAHPNPERTASRVVGVGMDFELMFQIWRCRADMARAIRAEQKTATLGANVWQAVQPLSDGEGYR